MNDSEIEKLVLAKKAQPARQEIMELLRRPTTPRRKLRCAEWLRRLGLYKDGLKVLDEIQPHEKEAKTNTLQQRNLLRARVLNQLGASEYSLQLIENIEVSSHEDCGVVGDIYQANSMYRQASHFLRRSYSTADWSYSARMNRIGHADALAGQENFQSAIQLAGKVLTHSQEPILMAICHQAIGEYHARAGSIGMALKELEKAQLVMPSATQGVDRAFLDKWLGYSYALSGREKLGKKHLRQSEEILKATHFRREMFLEVQRLKSELGWLSVKDMNRLRCYPGRDFLQREISKDAHFGGGRDSVTLFPRSGEKKSSDGWSWGVGLEDQLAASAVIAGNWGLNTNSMKGLFWPEAVYEFSSLDARMNQLIQRVQRKFGLRILQKKGTLLLEDTSSAPKVVVSKNPAPSFLVQFKEFKRQDLSNHYRFSESQAKVVLRDWLQSGWINRKGSGPSSRYLRAKTDR